MLDDARLQIRELGDLQDVCGEVSEWGLGAGVQVQHVGLILGHAGRIFLKIKVLRHRIGFHDNSRLGAILAGLE